MATNNIFHPNLIGEIFASRFRTILMKCEIWLEEKYGMDFENHKRKLPPWYEYVKVDEEGNETGVVVPNLCNFDNPMNWPCFVHSSEGMKRAKFVLSYLWDVWYMSSLFEWYPSPEGFGPGKACKAKCNTNLTSLQSPLIGFLEPLTYMKEVGEEDVVELSEERVFKEYYFNSLFDGAAMIGPLRGVNHNPRSGLTFKKKMVSVPVYSGLDYFIIKGYMATNYKPHKYFYRCIDIPGVVLWSRSHTIDIRKGSQITCNYTGRKAARPDETPVPPFEFALEREHWQYPVPYAARGRLYFNETSEDNDYFGNEVEVEEVEKLKDGCHNMQYPSGYDEYPIIYYPETPEESEAESEVEEMGEENDNEG